MATESEPTVFKSFTVLKALGRARTYRKLDQSHKEIRVVELFPKAFRKLTRRSDVSCYTETISLTDDTSKKIPYIALSYAPGDALKTAPIRVDNRTVQVPTTLAAALQRFEHERLAMRIWVEAVCVNPVDDAEMSYLAQMRSEIFRRAEEVLVWLGVGTNGSDSAMRALVEIGNEAVKARAEAWVKAEHNEDLWTYNMEEKRAEIRDRWFPDGVTSFYRNSTENILQRPWFRRIGALQEAALNENVHFVCGNKSIPKFVLWDAIMTITQISNSMRAERRLSTSELAPLPETLPQVDIVSHRILDFVIHPSCETLEELLMFTNAGLGTRSFDIPDPRDRVYALVGLAKDANVLDIRMDYWKPIRVVYAEVAEAILKHSSSLSILYACGKSKNIVGLPSWVPDWTIPVPSTLGSRANGSIFYASGKSSRPDISFKTRNDGTRLLEVGGYRFDTVEAVMYPRWDSRWELDFTERSPVVDFLDNLNGFTLERVTAYGTGAERSEAVWRTPIADTDAHFLEFSKVDDQILVPRSRASRRMKRAFEALTGNCSDALDTEWRKVASMPYVDVLKREFTQRRLFTTSKGYLGLGGEDVRAGDSVCILEGGDSPFLLRGRSKEGSHWVIGEAYVYGIMNGEFIKTKPKKEIFELE